MRTTSPNVPSTSMRIAYLHGPLDQQNEPGDEIGNDALQAETDAHTQRAAQYHQAAQVHAQRLKSDGEAQQKEQIGTEAGQCVLLSRLHGRVREYAPL
jgi:hypothetical protein